MQPEVLPEKTLGTEAPKCSRDSSVRKADFSELMRLHWEQVFRTCLCIVRNHHDAEDAAQDCFLRAFSHLDQFQGEAQFSTWLNSIARNCSLMLLRRRRNRPEGKIENWSDSNGNLALFDPPDSRPDQLSCVLRAESLGLLVKSIAALPTTLRATAELIILNERTPQEVGQILEVPYASVKSRLFRARGRLKRSPKARIVIKGELR
jgi:RNA polymerase sigma-70 factor, ECF subfamily